MGCETPEGFSRSEYKRIGPKGKGHLVRRSKRKRQEPRSFEEKFWDRTMDDGLSVAVNNSVTPNYGEAKCHELGMAITTFQLQDAGEVDKLIQAAFSSDPSCKTVFTGNAGNTTSAGLPYAKTFAHSMIQDMCNPNKAQVGDILSGPSLGSKDAMSLSIFNTGMKKEKHLDNLATTYSLMYSLGQRESDGNLNEGRDMSANNKSMQTREAGLFQVSANSLNLYGKTPETKYFLKGIFKSFVDDLSSANKEGKEKICLNNKLVGTKETRSPASSDDVNTLFSSGVCKTTKSHMKTVRYSSIKVAGCFQQLTKKCPAFAIKYGAGVARINRKHNGPLITHQELHGMGLTEKRFKKPYLKPACHGVFKALVANKAKICSVPESSQL